MAKQSITKALRTLGFKKTPKKANKWNELFKEQPELKPQMVELLREVLKKFK